MNPPTTAPLVDNATPMLFPDGNLAYDNDEELSHLAGSTSQGLRKCRDDA